MKYILDFDRTLFDTELLYQSFDRDGIDRTQLHPSVWESYQAKDFLYSDTIPFLSSHDPSQLIILTAYGSKYGPAARQYQQAKVEQSPIINLVSDIQLVTSDKATAVQRIAASCDPAEGLVFVDDLLEHCRAVKAAVPRCQCFLMQRPGVSVDPIKHPDITLIHTLHEIDGL